LGQEAVKPTLPLRRQTNLGQEAVKPALRLRRQTTTVHRYVEPLPLAEDAIPLALIWIPGDRFLMGSPEDEEGREPVYTGSESQHLVEIPSFALGQYPITQAQWQAVAAMPQQKKELNPDPSGFKGANHPVEKVSWEDAQEFCARLAAKTGHGYRLPSEAEWEYACRARTGTSFHFGDTLSPQVANYNCSATYGTRGVAGKQIGQTTPVNQYNIANRFGLSDMHGNVWEWCQDDWHENYAGVPQDGTAWTAKNLSTARKVLRGGSWFDLPRTCRSAYRNYFSHIRSDNHIGLRVACSTPRTLAL
jgi:formylglycine-generating enzyme required for sulfatase activity